MGFSTRHRWQSANNAKREDIKHYVSTASVAADMLALTEEHGAWRQPEAKRTLAATSFGRLSPDIIVPQNLRHKVDGELTQYWGSPMGPFSETRSPQCTLRGFTDSFSIVCSEV